MKPIDEIRRDNMTQLLSEFGGISGLSRKLERSESQVSQWVRGAAHSVTGKKRGMKTDTARWIEVITEKPEGWLDADHSNDYLTARDRHFVLRVEQALARYEVAPNIQDAILGMITSQPARPKGAGDTDHPHPEAKAA